MEKLRNTLNKVLNLLAGLSMTVMVVLTAYQVIVRYIFNSPSTWSEELVGYLFGWSTMLGATIVSGERGHMNIAREVFFQERDAGKVNRDVLAHPHKRLRNKQGEDDHGNRQTQEHIFGEECFEFL